MSHAPFVDGMLRACIVHGTALAVPSPLAEEGQGGGYRLLRCLQYRKSNPLQIPHHITIGESQHAIPARRKPLIAPLVVANALFEIVAFAVDLNDELAGVRDEIGDVIADWSLPPKS
jgi:hypothetical protein